MRKTIARLLIGLFLTQGFFPSVMACSVCRCGDNVFQFTDQGLPLVGQDDARKLRLGFGSQYSSKSNALAGDEGVGTEEQKDFRPSVKAVYGLTDHLAVSGEVPLAFHRLTVTSEDGVEREKSSGVGDAEVQAQWMTNFASLNGHYFSWGLSLGLKLPTGQNNAQSDGVRVDEHLQNGTGSSDVHFGVALARSTCSSRSFASIYVRVNGANDFNYKYGDATLYNLGAQRSVSSSVIASLQLNARHARRDVENGEVVGNTGGSVAYLTPGLRIGLGNLTSLSVSVQVPAWDDLYGDQTEKAVLITGVNFSL